MRKHVGFDKMEEIAWEVAEVLAKNKVSYRNVECILGRVPQLIADASVPHIDKPEKIIGDKNGES